DHQLPEGNRLGNWFADQLRRPFPGIPAIHQEQSADYADYTDLNLCNLRNLRIDEWGCNTPFTSSLALSKRDDQRLPFDLDRRPVGLALQIAQRQLDRQRLRHEVGPMRLDLLA